MASTLKHWLLRITIGILTMAFLAAGALAMVAFWPLQPNELTAASNPITDYQTAKTRSGAFIALTSSGVLPECHSTILDHGHPVEDVYILLHGLTNCPAQFHAFGQILYEQGANVLIPRSPYHGLADSMNEKQQQLTAQKMLFLSNRAVDIAHAYGRRVTLVGLSVNGVTAAWLAQQRADIDRAVVMAPFFAPKGISDAWIVPLGRTLYRLPNLFLWWDPVAKENLPGPTYSYPRYATHPIAQILRMGIDVFAKAETAAPAAKQILVITTAADTAVENKRTEELIALWKKSAPEKIQLYTFPAEEQVPHDFIDPNQPGQKVALVYPKLLELLK